MHTTELILLKDNFSAEDWVKMCLVMAKHVGGVSRLSISVVFEENVIRFFAHSPKDISSLSNGLDGVLVRPADESKPIWEIPDSGSSQGLLKIPAGGNIIDVRQHYKVKTGKNLSILRLDVQRFASKMMSKLTAVFTLGNEHLIVRQQLSRVPGNLLAINFAENTAYIRTTMPIYVSLEKTMHLLQTYPENAVFSVPTFPYASKDYYLHLGSYEFDKHSFIVGASGSGKSKLIQIIIDRLSRQGNAQQNYRVVVIDPHASLEADLQNIPGARIVNLGNESAQLFPDENADISAATELTTTLFKSLMMDSDNPRLERVLRFSIYVLLTAQIMTLEHLKQFLTDLEFRTRVLEHVDGYVPQNLTQFFATDFNEIRTKYYTEAISPAVSLVDEMQLQPSLVGEAAQGLASLVQSNFLTVFSLNKMSMGEKAVKTVAGLLIQQMFLLAQSRIMPQKLMLIVDEVSVVQNPAIASILAEARKFNLSVVLTQQYFGQINKQLRDAILGNTVNYYVFRVSNEDAEELADNIVVEIPKEVLEQTKSKGLDEAGTKAALMTGLSPREAIVRVSAGGQMVPGIKVRTVDIETAPGSQKLFAGTLSGSKPKLKKLAKMDLDAPAKKPKSLDDSKIEAEPIKRPDRDEEPPQPKVLSPEFDLELRMNARQPGENLASHTAEEAAKNAAHLVVTHLIADDIVVPEVLNLQQVLAQQSSSRDNLNSMQ